MLPNRIKTRSIVFVILSYVLLHSQSDAAGFDESKPQFEKAALVVGEEVRKPIVNDKRIGAVQRSGKYSVANNDGKVSIRNTVTGAVSTVQHEEGQKWELGKTHNGVAYFFSLPADTNEKNRTKKLRIRRLDLEESNWLDDLDLGFKKEQLVEFIEAYVGDDYFVAVCVLMEEDDDSPYDRSLKSFWVSCFEVGKTKAKWKTSFKADKTSFLPSVQLWSLSNPDYADIGLRVVSRFEDRLIVCPEGKQSIRCLNVDTGTELWSCDRVWEFQRGFIGPSVYQHYIGRFRIDGSFGLDEREETEFVKAKKKFDENFECSIIGGPAIVELKKDGDNWRGSHSIFVAVFKQPKEALYGGLGESIVYELTDRGKVISTTNLPRLVNGSNFHVDETGIVWKCHGDQLVRLEPTDDSLRHNQGPFAETFDCQTPVPWLRTVSAKSISSNAWLTSGTACESTKMLNRFAVSVTEGGYVKNKGDALYEFPISITDTRNGAQKSLLIKVPFSGPILAPESNFSRTEDGYQTMGSHKLAITSFSFSNERLQIVMGSHGIAQNLEFKFQQKDLFGLFGLEQQIEMEDEVELPKDLTLLEAAHDPNTKRIKILLDRGADVNERSSSGWSALESAAWNGCLDTVELLINKGAEANFSSLSNAVSSGRSSKQKVKLLIEAGADIWEKTSSGSDLLTCAAGSGNVEVVELLLEKGMKANTKNKNDYTALMAAASEGSPRIIRLLLKAGAKVDAVDTRKRTALVYAANGYGNGASIKVLLEFGADPNLKDAKGRTAIDRCMDSNNSGAEKRKKILKAAMEAKK